MIIVISRPEIFEQEAMVLNQLFEAGMDRLHIRKPEASKADLEQLIGRISAKYRSNIAIHYHADIAIKFGLGGVHLSGGQDPASVPAGYSGTKSKSCHTFEEVEQYDGSVDYMFLSPVRSSISKKGYKSKWSDDQLKAILAEPRKSRVMALGGINGDNAAEVIQLGFDGIAVLGAVWQSDDPDLIMGYFEQIKKSCQQTGHIL